MERLVADPSEEDLPRPRRNLERFGILYEQKLAAHPDLKAAAQALLATF